MPKLIYSGDGNRRFLNISLNHGFEYGAQLPGTTYHKLYFADQNWKNPRRPSYMEALARERPFMATVLDLEKEEQFEEVMDWAEEATQHVEVVQIIPKVPGIIKKLPKYINNKQVVLGFSVPSKYGSTDVSLEEFKGWEVHLLGGSPKKQIKYYKNFSNVANVISIDINYHRMKATRFCEYWGVDQKWHPDGYKNKKDACYAVFEKSCINIKNYWDASR